MSTMHIHIPIAHIEFILVNGNNKEIKQIEEMFRVKRSELKKRIARMKHDGWSIIPAEDCDDADKNTGCRGHNIKNFIVCKRQEVFLKYIKDNNLDPRWCFYCADVDEAERDRQTNIDNGISPQYIRIIVLVKK